MTSLLELSQVFAPDDLPYFQLVDLYMRMVGNQNVSAMYRCLYIALVDTYPSLLVGDPVKVNVYKVREAAGWASEASATKFLQDMIAIGAISTYDSGDFNRKEVEREGTITVSLGLFPFPEKFNTRDTEKRKKGREAEQKKREMVKRLILQCEECGSGNLRYDLIPRCKDCGHRHTVIRDVPASDLTLAEGDSDAENLPANDLDGFREPAPRAPSFTDVPRGEKWPLHCRTWKLHKPQWKYGLAGMYCPVCEPGGV